MTYENISPDAKTAAELNRTVSAISSLRGIAQALLIVGSQTFQDKAIRVTTFEKSTFTYHYIDWYQPDSETSNYPRLTIAPVPSGSIECFAVRDIDKLDYMPMTGSPVVKGREGIDEMAYRIEKLVSDLLSPDTKTIIDLVK